jgi:hypothetical protein
MARARQLIMAGGTFSVALGIGFVMQNGDALAGRFTDETQAPPVLSQPLPIDMPQVAVGGLPQDAMTAVAPLVAEIAPIEEPQPDPVLVATAMPEDTATPTFEVEGIELAAAEASETMTDMLPVAPPEPVASAPVCDSSLIAVLGAAAMVDLTLTAPCSPDAAVVIHHQGMMFTLVTDSAGKSQVSVPALAEVSVFVAALDDGSGAAASIMVSELANFDRAVLQWQGVGGMGLHALEFGASYADEGHVWAGAARDATTAAGGFMTRLGDDAADNPMIAEIYTFPIGAASRDGTVDLSVEAEVTSANCGRDVSAQSIQIMPGSEPTVMDLTMTMPDCAAVGEYLVLNNMLQDLTLAAN